VRLAAADAVTGGMLVQRVPGAGGTGIDAPQAEEQRIAAAQGTYAVARAALAGIGSDELLLRPAEELVQRCVPGLDLRLHGAQPVQFVCRCSRERVSGMLRSLGEPELREVLAEQGAVTVTCEFCHRPYRFDAIDVGQLFTAVAPPPGPRAVN
jgi:molecular chaperone Hsp33